MGSLLTDCIYVRLVQEAQTLERGHTGIFLETLTNTRDHGRRENWKTR